jgi:membrane protein
VSRWGRIAARLALVRIAFGRIDERTSRAVPGSDGSDDGGQALSPGGPSRRKTPGGVPSRRGPDSSESPLQLDAPDWKQTIKRTFTEVKEDRVTLVAAGMSYYFFLSIFPAFLALIGILNLVDIDSASLVESIKSALPRGAGQVVTSALEQTGDHPQAASLLAAISGIAVALWSASSGFVALQSGLNIAYDVPEDRKFVGKRAVALLLILATGFLGGVPSPIFTFGEDVVFKIIGWVLTVGAVSLLFSLYYYFAPNRESPQWHWVSVGGIVGMLIWLAASAGFAVYVNEFGNYERTYGPVAGVIILLLWLYLTSISVLVGGELNSEIERQAESTD